MELPDTDRPEGLALRLLDFFERPVERSRDSRDCMAAMCVEMCDSALT